MISPGSSLIAPDLSLIFKTLHKGTHKSFTAVSSYFTKRTEGSIVQGPHLITVGMGQRSSMRLGCGAPGAGEHCRAPCPVGAGADLQESPSHKPPEAAWHGQPLHGEWLGPSHLQPPEHPMPCDHIMLEESVSSLRTAQMN